MPHGRLITKLKGYGIGGKLLAWIQDFLNNRTQFVTIKDTHSDEIPVTSGVPQGSVLGPTLFIYYINDMPTEVECGVKIFADDTKLYSTVTSYDDRDMLQTCIDRLVQWTNTWLLQFNEQKCKVLHLGKNNPGYDYFIKKGDDSYCLETTTAVKDLGVIVDPLLNFDTHINSTIKKANRIAGLLVHTITNKTKEIMVPLFKALVRPILEYGNSVWSPYLKKHTESIEAVQRRFTKRIVGNHDLTYEQRLEKLNLPSLEFRRRRGDLIEVYKIVHKLYDPITTKSLFTFSDVEITRGHNLKLAKKLTKSRPAQNFFTNRIITIWNNLPATVVNAKTTNSFKNQLDKYYKQQLYQY